MPMPATRKGKSEPAEKEASVRKSPRKRNISKATETTDKTPKRTRRKSLKFPKEFDAQIAELFNTPSTSYTRDNGKVYDNGNVCSFYKTGRTPNGQLTYNKRLIKYFLKIDSPEMADLKAKRFNTSFLHEIPRSKDSLKIFTEEEENEKKLEENEWLKKNGWRIENSKLPEIPGTEYKNAFETIPFANIGDSDEECKIESTGKNKKRKSVRCTEFKGKPLPDHSLLVDYSSLLDLESSWEDDEDEHEGNIMDAVKNNNGILYSLLSSPTNKPVTQDKDDNLVRTEEDEMLFNKYKDILSNKKVRVVLTRLPIDSHLLQLSVKERVNAKPAAEFKEKKKVSNEKKNVDEKVKVSKPGLPKCQKRKNGNTKSMA